MILHHKLYPEVKWRSLVFERRFSGLSLITDVLVTGCVCYDKNIDHCINDVMIIYRRGGQHIRMNNPRRLIGDNTVVFRGRDNMSWFRNHNAASSSVPVRYLCTA